MNFRKVVCLSLALPLLNCVRPKDSPRPSVQTKPATGIGEQNPSAGEPLPTEPEGTVVTYPLADADLGEVIHPSEVKAADEISKTVSEQIKAKAEKTSLKRVLRDAHPKMHGCVRAQFAVDPAIEDRFAQGVFAKGNKFDAVIRYSNSSSDATHADIEKDGRGMAFKLFHVPGKKLLDVESNAETQDFIFISHPVFFTDDPDAYITFMNNIETNQAKALIALGIRGGAIALKIVSLTPPASVMSIPYFSNVPYQLGVGAAKKAVKYMAKSCGTDETGKKVVEAAKYKNGNFTEPKSSDDPNYLRTRLLEQYKTSDSCIDIFVQERENPAMSVENSMIEWTTAWHKVATLTAKKENQDIANSPDLAIPSNKACDSLSFNPWHSLPEHKPLGSMNRIRKIVYERISAFRHTQNNEPRKEPTRF